MNRTLLIACVGVMAAFALAVCHRSTPQTSAPTESLVESATASESTGSSSARETEDREPSWVAFVEPVKVKGEFSDRSSFIDFVDGYALIGGEGYALLRLEDLTVVDMPPFEAPEHNSAKSKKPSPRYVSGEGASWGLAWFEGDLEASFEIFDPARLRWEAAGSLELTPKDEFDTEQKTRPEDDRRPRFTRVQATVRGEEIIVWISADGVSRREYRLDRESLVWRDLGTSNPDANTCFVRCDGLGRDLVRWGIGVDSPVCAAARSSEEEDWVKFETDDLVMARSCHALGDERILVVGGLDFGHMFPTSSKRADIVELSGPTLRRLPDRPAAGRFVELSADDYVWMSPDSVVEFDPGTETFELSQLPGVDFDHRGTIRIDERTFLAWGLTDDRKLRFARFGYRRSPQPSD